LWFVGIADHPGDARESGEFFGGALRVAPSDNQADGRVGSVKLANGVAGLSICGGRDRAGVEDNDVGSSGLGGGSATAVEQLALDGSAIGLRGTATKLFDEEGRHPGARPKKEKIYKEFTEHTENAEKKRFMLYLRELI
jgi:hypothetical protein